MMVMTMQTLDAGAGVGRGGEVVGNSAREPFTSYLERELEDFDYLEDNDDDDDGDEGCYDDTCGEDLNYLEDIIRFIFITMMTCRQSPCSCVGVRSESRRRENFPSTST